MKFFLKIVTILFLVFNTAGAIYGGYNLVIYPDGSSMQLSLNLLKNTPFNTYFFPGIILLAGNGLFGLVTLATMLFRIRIYPLFIIAQGAILTVWILIQILLIKTLSYFHIILAIMGLALILLGILQQKMAATKTLSVAKQV